ncbi:MAG: hypothetical protein D6772_04080 [Bacteroidetes bacterium]|nr:MAG: hypothetical protein D6772_04080 [Bacteroidota bacterium]
MKTVHKTGHLFLLYLLGFQITLPAQPSATNPSMEAILASAWADSIYLQMKYDQVFLDQAKMDLPRMEELEFRTETQNFDPNRQEYALRLQLHSTKQIKAQAAIRAHQRQWQEFRQEAYLENLLYQRYQLLIALQRNQQWQTHYAAEQALLNDHKQIIEHQLNQEGEAALAKLLRWEDKQASLREKQRRLAQERHLLQQQLSDCLPSTSSLSPNWASFPDLADLQARASEWPSPLLSKDQQRRRLETEEIALEMAEEQAEQRNLLNFIQLRYTGDNDPIFRDRLTLGAGIRLPFRNSNQVKMQYLELERREEERKEQQQQQEETRDWAQLQQRWQAQVELYQQAIEEVQRFEQNYTPQHLINIGVQDAEVILQAQEGLLKRRAQALRYEAEALEQFIDLLLLSGRMTARPYRNWLTNIPLVGVK